jgi:hypothetical protein
VPHNASWSPALSAGPEFKGTDDMQDIIFVGIALAFFAVCVAYVRGLDRLVRGSEAAERATDMVGDPRRADAVDVTS